MSEGLAERLLAGFADHYGGAPALVARAPGRVNLIGEHTDYNDGFALPIAIGAETRVALRPRTDGQIRVAALDLAETDAFAGGEVPARVGGWRDYVRGTCAVLSGAGIPVTGADITIAGDIPKGTGLSSSASLEVAVAVALLAQAGVTAEPRRVALWAQAAENDFVGVRCGNLDQIASAATVEGAALLIDCRSLALTPVPIPDDTVVMIVQSGVVRGLVDGAYNDRRCECEAAARVLGVPALRDATLDDLMAAKHAMDDLILRRARHVITENDRTRAAAAALTRADLTTMARLMRESHASQRDDFGIVVPETDRLAAIIDDSVGVDGGARQTGGGFGGAVVALMRNSVVDHAIAAVKHAYRTPDGRIHDIRIERAAGGAAIV